jgi:hypothetical protein
MIIRHVADECRHVHRQPQQPRRHERHHQNSVAPVAAPFDGLSVWPCIADPTRQPVIDKPETTRFWEPTVAAQWTSNRVAVIVVGASLALTTIVLSS